MASFTKSNEFQDAIKKTERFVVNAHLLKENAKTALILDKLCERQWFIYRVDSELLIKVFCSDNCTKTDDIVYDYYSRNSFEYVHRILDNLCKSSFMLKYQPRLKEARNCFENKLYLAGTMVLFSIIDGFTYDFLSTKESNSFLKKLEFVEKKISENELDYVGELIFIRFLKDGNNNNSMFMSCSFNSEEPSLINRHWIMHGHSTSSLTDRDFIKVLVFLYSLVEIHDCLEFFEKNL